MIIVIDYGVGNVGSVLNMLKKVGAEARLGTKPSDLAAADAAILPGVGHFAAGMAKLRASGFDRALVRFARQAPVLGICLGMQLLGCRSEEGDCDGLGLVDAEFVRFARARMPEPLPVPHMGWNAVTVAKDCWLTRDLPAGSHRFRCKLACAEGG